MRSRNGTGRGAGRGGWLLFVLLLGAHAAHAQPAAPAATPAEEEQRAQAKQRFEQGVADYDAGRYEQALANFQEAYRLRPHPLVNVNIANCYDKLGKPLQAVFHFERFIDAQAGTPEQRTEVVNALERLRKQIGQLLLRVTPDGATVTIDQGEQRRSPIMEAIKLEGGKHTIEVRLAGYRTLQRSVTVRGGTTLELNLALERESEAPEVLSVTPAPAPAPAPEPTATAAAPAAPATQAPLRDTDLSTEPPAQGGDVPTSVWIAGGISAGLGVAALVTGVMALSADSDFESRADQLRLATNQRAKVMIYEQASDAADDAQALALTTDILLVATALGVAVTTYLALSHDGGAETEAAPAAPHATLAPVLGRHTAGVQLRATF
jgi:tetratricopeptide (TPR) repeat protein